MYQALVAGLSPQRPGFTPRSVMCGNCGGRGTCTGFSPSSSVFPVNIIPPGHDTHVCHLVDKQ
jgi:hypothetical protein